MPGTPTIPNARNRAGPGSCTSRALPTVSFAADLQRRVPDSPAPSCCRPAATEIKKA